MTTTVKIDNQYPGSSSTIVSEMCKHTSRTFDNPKWIAVHALVSMMEAHIELCADYNLSVQDIEGNLSTESVRVAAREMVKDWIGDLEAEVLNAINDPEFFRSEIVKLTLDRDKAGTYSLGDADVKMGFDFKGTR